MVYDLNPAICNFPQSSTSSCTELFCEAASKCRPEQQCRRSSHCQRCCLNSMINDHTYSVLKRICRKIIKDFNRQQCREKYTIFDGGNSVNVRIHRSASAGCNKTLTDSKYKLGACDSTGLGERGSKHKKSFSSSAVGRYDDARDRKKRIGDAENALKQLTRNRSRSSTIGLAKDRSRTSNRGEHRKSRGRDEKRSKSKRKQDDDEHDDLSPKNQHEKRKSKSKKRPEKDIDEDSTKKEKQNKSKHKKGDPGGSSDDDDDANVKKKRKSKGPSVDKLVIPDLREKVRSGQEVAPATTNKKKKGVQDDNRINELDKDVEKMLKTKQKRKSSTKDLDDNEKEKGKAPVSGAAKEHINAPQPPPSKIQEKGTAKEKDMEKIPIAKANAMEKIPIAKPSAMEKMPIARANGLDKDADTPRKDKAAIEKVVGRSNVVDKSIGTGKGDGLDKVPSKGRGSIKKGGYGYGGPPSQANVNAGGNNHGRSSSNLHKTPNARGRSNSNFRGKSPNPYGGAGNKGNAYGGRSGSGVKGGGRFRDFDKTGVAGVLGRSMPNIRGSPQRLTKSSKDRYNGLERYGGGRRNKNGRYYQRGLTGSRSMHDRRSSRYIRPSRCDEARPCDYLRANMEQRELCEICTQRSGPSRYTNSTYSGNDVCCNPCNGTVQANTSFIC